MTTLLAVAAALAAALGGCGTQGHTDGGLRPAAARPTTYVVTGVTEHGEPRRLVPGTEIRLRFADGRLTLTAGCNTMSGSYDLDGSRLRVASLASTEMGCDRARMDQDTWLGGLFARPVQLTDGKDAAVISGETVLSLADREQVSPDQPLVGTTWLLDTVTTTGGDGTASSVPRDVRAWIVFDDKGRVRASDGLNEAGGPVRISGDRIRFGDLGWTTVGCTTVCPYPDLGQVLHGTATYTIDERSLTLTNGSHGLGFHAVDKLPPIR